MGYVPMPEEAPLMTRQSVRGVIEGHNDFLSWFDDEPGEREGFLRFFESAVQRKASELDCVFFVEDTTTGIGGSLPDMYPMDLYGWLIPSEEADKFEAIWRELEPEDIHDIERWKKYFLVECWKVEDDEAVEVDFVGCDDYKSSFSPDVWSYIC